VGSDCGASHASASSRSLNQAASQPGGDVHQLAAFEVDAQGREVGPVVRGGAHEGGVVRAVRARLADPVGVAHHFFVVIDDGFVDGVPGAPEYLGDFVNRAAPAPAVLAGSKCCPTGQVHPRMDDEFVLLSPAAVGTVLVRSALPAIVPVQYGGLSREPRFDQHDLSPSLGQGGQDVYPDRWSLNLWPRPWLDLKHHRIVGDERPENRGFGRVDRKPRHIRGLSIEAAGQCALRRHRFTLAEIRVLATSSFRPENALPREMQSPRLWGLTRSHRTPAQHGRRTAG
jgi:hypothetical protein